MAIYKCKMCGGTLRIEENQEVGVCEYCSTKQTLPLLNDEKRENLYNAASELRKNNEYDRAIKVYESILEDDSTDAEAYWCLVLCKYGIEYVEDPITQKIVPTINRTHYTSVFADGDYKLAIKYASEEQKRIYEEQAREIDEIQKGILEISKKEEPFDVFICYKETDKNGRRTRDSVLATELYHELIEEGFKVFFSRITLEDKLGSEYEPYIFAALNSAKIMVVLGTSEENFKSVWVRNEWSRYLSLIKNGEEKVLIPAYRDMDPYDLPEEFSNLQAQDMSKLGFMQDLIRGIEKILGKEDGIVADTIILNENVSVENLIKRIKMFLEDKDFESANEYCERALDMDPVNAKVYLYKLLIEYGVSTLDELKECKEDFSVSSNYKRVIRFGDKDLINNVNLYLNEAIKKFKEEKTQEIYYSVIEKIKYAFTIEDYQKIINDLNKIIDYKDSKILLENCQNIQSKMLYEKSIELMKNDSIEHLFLAKEYLERIPNWKDASKKYEYCNKKIERLQKEEEVYNKNIFYKVRDNFTDWLFKGDVSGHINTCIFVVISVVIGINIFINSYIEPRSYYNEAVEYANNDDYYNAMEYFEMAGEYKDAQSQYEKYYSIVNYNEAVMFEDEKDYGEAAVLYSNAGDYKDAKEKSLECYNKVKKYYNSMSFYDNNFIAIKEKKEKYDNEILFENKDDFYDSYCSFSSWENIVSVCMGERYYLGLRSDGVVELQTRYNYSDYEYNIGDWTNVVAIDTYEDTIVCVQSDGTAKIFTDKTSIKDAVEGWMNLADVKVRGDCVVALKKDGTIVSDGLTESIEEELAKLKNISKIEFSNGVIACLTKSGKVIVVGDSNKFDVSKWKNIKDISLGSCLVGLKSDGTVVQTGGVGISRIDKWENIVDVYTCNNYIAGLKNDGSVVFVGNDYQNMKKTLSDEKIKFSK